VQASAQLSRGRTLRQRLVEFVIGPPFARRIVLSHAIDDFGDAMFNLSLVGSLFLSVSLDASRTRIMAYLLLTVAPLVLVGPLVGHVLDRTRYGYSIAISGSQVLRAAASIALIGSLLTVALFPLTFVVLVCRKVYALAKTALLTQLTNDPHELLKSDAHIARTGTIAGGIGTAVGGVLLATDNVEAMLVMGGAAFLLAALISRSLPTPTPPLRTASAPSLRDSIPHRIWSATLAVTAVRAAGGALTYLLAFAIKRGGSDEWIFAVGLLAAGGGGLAANLLASRIHRRLDSELTLVLALLVPGLVCGLGVVTVGDFGVLAIAFSIGLGRGVGTRAITILNAGVPRLARARAIARSELLFQGASLVGAMLAVQLSPSPNAGFAVSGILLTSTGLVFGFRRRHSLKQHTSRMLLGDHAPAVESTLPVALLAEAQRLALLGAYRMAVVIASSAVDILIERTTPLTNA